MPRAGRYDYDHVSVLVTDADGSPRCVGPVAEFGPLRGEPRLLL
jgi:hypothetical protein